MLTLLYILNSYLYEFIAVCLINWIMFLCLSYQAFQLDWMTVWRQLGYDFKHVEWGAKVCFNLSALSH